MKTPRFLSQYHFRAWHRRLLMAMVDGFGYTLKTLACAKPKDLPAPESVHRILAIRNDSLGDFLMTLPALRALSEKYPSAQLDLVVASDGSLLARSLPFIHEIYEAKSSWFSSAFFGKKLLEAEQLIHILKKNRYDLGVDFRGDFRNLIMMKRAHAAFTISYGATGGGFLLDRTCEYPQKLHQVLVNFELLKTFGIESAPTFESFPICEESRNRVEGLLPKLFRENIKPLIAIHTSAGYPSKRWPHENYRSLIKTLTEGEFAKIVLIGTRQDQALFDFSDFDPLAVQDLRGKCALPDLPALYSLSDLYLGNDSGPAHLAALSGIPMVILFSGTTDPKCWGPWSKSLTLITHPVPCSPCHAKICPLKHHACLEEISVQEVLQTLQPHLKSYSVSPKAPYEI